MSEAQELIAAAKQLVAEAETEVNAGAEPDLTQLRIAVNRMWMFVDHLGQLRPVEPVAERVEGDGDGAPDDGLEAMSRKDLNAKASELGVDAPDKLPNKDTVIAAIREAAEPVEGDE